MIPHSDSTGVEKASRQYWPRAPRPRFREKPARQAAAPARVAIVFPKAFAYARQPLFRRRGKLSFARSGRAHYGRVVFLTSNAGIAGAVILCVLASGCRKRIEKQERS